MLVSCARHAVLLLSLHSCSYALSLARQARKLRGQQLQVCAPTTHLELEQHPLHSPRGQHAQHHCSRVPALARAAGVPGWAYSARPGALSSAAGWATLRRRCCRPPGLAHPPIKGVVGEPVVVIHVVVAGPLVQLVGLHAQPPGRPPLEPGRRCWQQPGAPCPPVEAAADDAQSCCGGAQEDNGADCALAP